MGMGMGMIGLGRWRRGGDWSGERGIWFSSGGGGERPSVAFLQVSMSYNLMIKTNKVCQFLQPN